MWRRRQEPPKPEPRLLDRYVELPVGTCLKTENGYYYINVYNNNIIRLKITSERILNSWNFNYIVHSTESIFAKVKVLGFLGFRSGTVVKDISSSLYYIIDNGKKRKIENPDYITSLGLNLEDVLLISSDEANLHKDGEVIK